VGLVLGLTLTAPLSFVSQVQAQEAKMSREGGSWAQEVTGSLAAVKNLRVKVDMGSVVVRGGQQQGINYVFHTRFGNSSEQEARKQFEQYKVTAYVKGDTAWITGDWQGRTSSAAFFRRVLGYGSARDGAGETGNRRRQCGCHQFSGPR
jgi:hypothetical protein